MAKGDSQNMSFWDHIDELRGNLIRSVLVILFVFFVLFFFKSFVFDSVVLAPLSKDFPMYRLLGISPQIRLINIEISAQFFIHIKVTFLLSLILSTPIVLFELWRFVAPALYENEKAAFKIAFGVGTILFYAGLSFAYLVLLPIILYFFEGYELSSKIINSFSLSSYISLFNSMTLMMGLLFEFPSVAFVLSKLGIINRKMMRGWRRYAVVVILILAAVLTPTGDPFTMLVVALPVYLLYELSILICRKDDIDK